MDDFEYCAACLITDVKMYNLTAKHPNNSSSTLAHAFARLLQIPTFEESHNVCFECIRLMFRFQEFISKCHKAQSILSTLKMVDDAKTVRRVIHNVDRKFYKLSSNLTYSYIITTSSTADEDSKTVDAIPNVNMAQHKEIIETEITNVDNGNGQVKENKNSVIKDNEKIIFEDNDDQDNVDYEDNDNDENDVNYNSDIEDTSGNKVDDPDEADDLPTEYIHYADENSLDNDILLKIDNNEAPKVTEECSRKRIIDVNVINEVTDLYDEEPLSKLRCLSKTNHEKRSTQRVDQSFFRHFITVVNLTPEDAKREWLLRKESKNYKECLFQCDFCYEGYDTNTVFNYHMKSHYPECGEYECGFCHLRFSEKKALHKHHMNYHKKKFFCNLCPYMTYAIEQARNHVTLHRKKTYPCEDYGMSLRIPNSLRVHRRKKHVTECVCELCGTTFATSRGLHLHNKQVHWKVRVNRRPYKCPICENTFTNLNDRQLHIECHHKTEPCLKRNKTKRKNIEEVEQSCL